ncbi:MAG TPA: ABC transporter permease [Gaiellaceae bacterium]|nr:ABC transporter permease [Gaiellaceae bacterium]
MSAVAATESSRFSVVAGEIAKLPAFIRRDFLVAWSYRASFFSDWFGLLFGALMFYFVGRMVDPSALPSYGGTRAGYMEFVSIGVALGAFIALALRRVAAAVRGEQLMGTLESVLLTPTSPATIQIGSVVYDLLYIPIRTGLFLLFIGIAFGLHFEVGGVLPATLALLVFIPFVWGLGVASAGATLTFRGGSAGIGAGVTLLTIGSGAFFPLQLLPSWIATVAEYNPMTLALEGMRRAIIGGEGWSAVAPKLMLLAPMSAASLAGGILVFRLAMRRERRRGTLGMY